MTLADTARGPRERERERVGDWSGTEEEFARPVDGERDGEQERMFPIPPRPEERTAGVLLSSDLPRAIVGTYDSSSSAAYVYPNPAVSLGRDGDLILPAPPRPIDIGCEVAAIDNAERGSRPRVFEKSSGPSTCARARDGEREGEGERRGRMLPKPPLPDDWNWRPREVDRSWLA